jgi:hypothetical protein
MVIVDHQTPRGPKRHWNAVVVTAVDDSVPRRFLRRLLLAIAVGALMLPVFGPMLEHHFAERQLDHVHIYSGPTVPDHVHPYETPHSHSPGQTHNKADDVLRDSSSKSTTSQEIVYLTSQEGSERGFGPFSTPLLRGDVFLPEPPDDWFLSSLAHDDLPFETFIPPPETPPRG